MPNLKVMITLGRIGHTSALKALGLKEKDFPFSHNGQHTTDDGLIIISSYHCSRYNTQTGRLTEQMFRDVFAAAIAARA